MKHSELPTQYLNVQSLEKDLGSPFDPGQPISFQTSMVSDEKELFPNAEVKHIEDWGVSAYFVPVNLGGKLAQLEETLGMIRALAKRDLTVAIGKSKTLLGSLPVWISGSAAQKKLLATQILENKDVSLALTERDHGADLLASSTRAHKIDSDHYEVSGEKWLINNATRSAILCVLAKTAENINPRALSLFFIEKAKIDPRKFKLLPKIKTHGIRGADISGIEFQKVELNLQDLIGKEGHGLDHVLKTFQVSRTLCTALSLGAAETAFSLVFKFANERVLHGKPIWEIPEVKKQLVDLFVSIWICDAVAMGAVRSMHYLPEEMSYLSAVAKYFVPEKVETIIQKLAVILGARHYLREEFCSGIFQKIQRDHSLVPLFDGSTHINLTVIASQLPSIASAQNEAKSSLSQELIACFSPDQVPPAYPFSNHKFSSLGQETWLDGLSEYEAHPQFGFFAKQLTAERKKLDVHALGGPVSHEDAQRRCLLHAGAAALFTWRGYYKESELGTAWLNLALQQVLSELKIESRLRAELDQDCREKIAQEIFRRATAKNHLGIVELRNS